MTRWLKRYGINPRGATSKHGNRRRVA
jgi:hypothetical protein